MTLINKKFAYIFAGIGVVEETRVGGRTVAQLNTEFLFKSLTEYVSARVPESIATFGVFKSEKLDLAAAFQRSGGIPFHPSFSFEFSVSFGVD
jgi:hypothetical protein